MAAHGIFHYLVVLGAAEEDADAGVFVGAFAVAVECLQVEGQFAHVFRFKAAGFEFKRHETLQVTMVEEQIKFKILIAHLHTNPFSDICKAVAQFHEEFPQVA